jgi:hypothetical protein
LEPERRNGRVLAGENQQHAGGGLGLADVERANAGMRVRRAQENPARGARRFDIVDIAAAPAQQVRIFLAGDWLPDTELAHGLILSK